MTTSLCAASFLPTLDQKIGHLLIVGFEGSSLGDSRVQATLNYAQKGILGGVILYRRNIESVAQVETITKAFQQKSPQGSPFFISVDQEGGLVQRLRPLQEGKSYPSAVELSTLSSAERQDLSKDMAGWIVSLGFNLNFAPVVDLYQEKSKVIGGLGRSFGQDPEVVSACAWDVIQGFRARGLLSCLKHFPGHGLVLEDSHKGWVDASEVASEEEFLPYEILLKKNVVDMVMTAHVFNRHQDAHHPATLSPVTINRLLRQNMGYEGVVVSDDLHMGGILQHYPIEEAIILALNAGCDLIILSNNPLSAAGVSDFRVDVSWPERFVFLVKEAIASGKISEERIHEAYGRVQKLWASRSRGGSLTSGDSVGLMAPIDSEKTGGDELSPVGEL